MRLQLCECSSWELTCLSRDGFSLKEKTSSRIGFILGSNNTAHLFGVVPPMRYSITCLGPIFFRHWTSIDVKNIPTDLVNWWFYQTLMIIAIAIFQLHKKYDGIPFDRDWHPKLHGQLWPMVTSQVLCSWIVSAVPVGHVNPEGRWNGGLTCLAFLTYCMWKVFVWHFVSIVHCHIYSNFIACRKLYQSLLEISWT